LKNIAEQVSILELNRDVNGDVISHYLPKEQKSNLPMFAGQHADKKSFESEREILYSVLFDMRRDITELRTQVQTLMSGHSHSHQSDNVPLYEAEEYTAAHPVKQTLHISSPLPEVVRNVEDSEYVEEAMSLEDMERRAIIQALERHRGKRRDAAKELEISERTLYRKIKEYGIE
jgi:DNA-binding NtrC family response regulator